MNVLEVKQLQIMRDQRMIIDNLSFELPEGHRLFYKVILVVGNQPYYTVY